MFRDWLSDFAARESSVREYEALMRDIQESGVRVGRRFTRDEMNER